MDAVRVTCSRCEDNWLAPLYVPPAGQNELIYCDHCPYCGNRVDITSEYDEDGCLVASAHSIDTRSHCDVEIVNDPIPETKGVH